MSMTQKTAPPEAANYEYLSFSAFNTLTECGEKYRITRLLKVDEGPTFWFAGGTAFHTGCDAVDYAILNDQEVPF